MRIWLAALASSHDHVHLSTFGTSTEGNPLDALFIGDLARGHRLNDQCIRRREVVSALLTGARAPEWSVPIVLITSGIHATEIGGPQSIPELVHWLVTSEEADAVAIRNHVLTIVVPTLNPDGMDLVTRWHERSLGTAHAGTPPPLLYHRFAGHDNNRDWLFRNLAETRAIIDAIHNSWLPHVTLDQHQMNKHGPRFVLPPYADPWEPHVHPSIIAASASLGQSIAVDLTLKGLPGVMTGRYFDAWEPSRAIQYYRGGIRILAEAASANLAHPIDVTEEQLRSSPLPQHLERTTSCPLPWTGGTWRLRDIVDYHLEAAKSLLRHVIRDPDRWGAIQSDALRCATTSHYSIRIPFDRSAIDFAANRQLSEMLVDAGSEVTQRKDDQAVEVSLDQPLTPLISAILLPKRYPSHLGPSPYDVTSHHLPLYMGAALQAGTGGRRPELRPIVRSHRYLSIDARSHAAPEIAEAARAESPCATWRVTRRELIDNVIVEPGTWIVDREALPDDNRASLISSGSLVNLPTSAARVRRWDIVLLRPDGVVGTDHGWTRWWLHARSIPFLEGELSTALQLFGVATSTTVVIAEPETSSIGADETDAIIRLIELGADVIAFGAAGRALAVGISSAVATTGFPVGESVQAPGALVRLQIEPGQRIGLGLDRAIPAMFQRDGVFVVDDSSSGVEVLARYAARDTLVSGWMSDTRPLRNAPAVVRVGLGAGNLYAFAFRPLFRGQTLVTSPLVHNLLYHTTESEPCPPSDLEKTPEGGTSAHTS